MSALWDPIFGRTAIAAATDDRAWVRALCDVEAALARACAEAGLLDSAAAADVTRACTEIAGSNWDGLGQRSRADGNPVIALIEALRGAVGASSASAVHLGATSQDIIDTATMLIVRSALGVIEHSLRAAEQSCARLAGEHRDTPMAARTLLQQAVLTTFGAVASGWGEGLDRVRLNLHTVRRSLCVQLGGAAGTLAGWYPLGTAVRAALAAELDLIDPRTVWHTERSRIADIACALGSSCGVVAKIATDVVLLAQTEIAEVGEGAGGRSSTMAHKHNPIAAVTARAAAAQAPGLVATVLAAMPSELQRGAGPWHAEWPALTSLLHTTGGAADRLATSLAQLQVYPARMASTAAELTGSGRNLGHAGDLVDHYLAERRP